MHEPDLDSEGQASAVEITPEMVEAGKDAFRDWYETGGLDDYAVDRLVIDILRRSRTA
jgi:hypothetical protein